jgi:GAF domain-containing protein
METPKIPEDEKERLYQLRSAGILDTPPEERFDRVTRMARRLFGVPIALVSLIDEHRQ